MTIEERIVKLGLNNNNFEKHAQESLKTLDRLDQGLKNFGNAVGFDKLGNMIDTVTHRFSAFGVAGDQVIRNLTNQVMNLVGQMGNLAKSMSFDQIEAGFSKYGDKTQAVQTIMAATAKDWEDQGAQMEWVNEQLEKLNWFTDETSYSFLDMVNNIGKFTSNGIGLEDSVTAMEGISTWAAISGANVQEASRAMYNLSQALATGSVKLIDWKSIENANMATREFKETALETAVALGTLKKNADGSFTVVKEQAEDAAETAGKVTKKTKEAIKTFTTEQFNTQLASGWFSKDVLMETLKTYGNFTDVLQEATEASNMTASQVLQEIEVYKQGGSVISSLVPYMSQLASAQNDLGYRAFKAAQEAKTFADAINATKDAVSTGWMNIFDKMFGNYLTAKEFWTDIAESFYNIFAEPVNKLNEIFDIAFGGGGSGDSQVPKKLQVLHTKLQEVGKTEEDLQKAFRKIDEVRLDSLISQYGSLEEAINRGAVGTELLKKLLHEVGVKTEAAEEIQQAAMSVDSFQSKLTKAGRSMADFERAILKSADRATLDMIENYGGVDKALKSGAISAELFKKALQEMAGEGSGAAEAVGEDISKLAGSMEKYRDIALQVLRGDLGNGAERREALERMGYDYEMIQWLAGNLQEYGYEVSDEFLLSLDKTEAVQKAFEQLMIDAGYTNEEIEAMNALLSESDRVLDDLKNGVAEIDRSGEAFDLANGGKLFREGLLNILRSIEDVTNAISEAFDIVFGGSEDTQKAIRSMGARLNDAIKRFHEFTEGLRMNEEEQEKFRNSIVGALRILQLLGSAIGKITSLSFKLAKGAFGIVANAVQNVLGFVTALTDRLNENGTFLRFSTGLQRVFESLKVPASQILELVTSIFKYFGYTTGLKNFSFLQVVGDWLTILSAKFSAATYKFKEFMTSSEVSEKIEKVFLSIFHALKSVSGIIPKILESFSKVFSLFSGSNNTEKMSIFSRLASAAEKAVSIIGNAFSKIKEIISNVFGGGGGVGLTKILSNLLKVFLGFTAVKGLGKIFGGIGDLFSGIGSIGEFLKNPASIFSNFINGFTEMLGITKKEGSFASDLRNIAVSIGILALSLTMLAAIPEEKLATSMGHLFTVMVELLGTMKGMAYIGGDKKLAFASAALIAIGSALLIVSAAMWVLSKINPDRLSASWEAMSLSLLTMVGILSLIGKIKLKPGNLLAVGAAMMGIAVAMLVLTASLAILAQIDGQKLAKAWEAMSLSLLSMVAALYLLSSVNSGKLLAAGAAMMGIAAAMLLLTASLVVLAQIDGEKLAKAWEAMSLSLLSMVAALYLLSGINVGKLLAAGAAMALVAASVLVVSVGLAVLSKVIQGNDEIMMGFIVTLLAMIAALALLAGVGPMVLAAGAALLLAGVGFVAIAAGMIALSLALKNMEGLHIGKIALQLLALAVPLALLGAAGIVFGLGGLGLAAGGAGLLVLGIALNKFNTVTVAPDYLLGLAGALLALGVAGIVFGVGGLGLAIGAPGLGELAEVLPALAEGVHAFSSISAGSLLATFLALAEAIGALFVLQFSTIHDGVPVLMEFAEAMPSLASGFSSFEGINGEAIANAGEGLGKAIKSLFTLQFSSFRDGTEALSNLAMIIPDLATGFQAFSIVDANMLTTAGTAISNAVKALFKLEFATIKDGTPQLKALGEALPTIAYGFTAFAGTDPTWLKEMSKALSSSLNELAGGGLFSKKPDFSSLVELGNALSQFWAGISDFSGMDVASPIAMIADLITQMQTSITNSLPAFETGSSEIPAAIARGIMNNSAVIANTMNQIISSLGRNFSVYDSAWNIIGGNISIGLANGIYRQSHYVLTAVSELATAVQRTLQNALEIHSPSRVMARIGGFIDKGLSQGILSESDDIKDSMIVAISPALAALNALADEDFSISPRIAPVVDLSMAQNASGALNDMFRSPSLYATVGRVTNEQANRYSAYGPTNTSNQATINELHALSEQVDALNEAITNMQIVLDSGVLVGATSAKMDQRLGQMAVRKGRGN